MSSYAKPPQEKPGPFKYRASCDRCSSNKVKCGQERPACQRCRSLDLPCHYSRSLRSGKPPGKGGARKPAETRPRDDQQQDTLPSQPSAPRSPARSVQMDWLDTVGLDCGVDDPMAPDPPSRDP